VGATMASETTAAAAGAVAKLRRDPFAMLPFCGYHVGDYSPRAGAGATSGTVELPPHLPGNLVPQGAANRYLWPGFGENSRVLACDRRALRGRPARLETAIASCPRPVSWRFFRASSCACDLERCSPSRARLEAELPRLSEPPGDVGDRLPVQLAAQLETCASAACVSSCVIDAAALDNDSSSLARMPHRVTLIPGDRDRPGALACHHPRARATGVDFEWDCGERGADSGPHAAIRCRIS